MHRDLDQRGVGMQAIIIFGTLVLAVVLLNGIAITLKKNEAVKSGRDVAVGYCGQTHQKMPTGCKVIEVYNCSDHYLLINNCLGTGDIVLSSKGAYQAWCGYASLDGAPVSCQPYWFDPQGRDCRLTKNLCEK